VLLFHGEPINAHNAELNSFVQMPSNRGLAFCQACPFCESPTPTYPGVDKMLLALSSELVSQNRADVFQATQTASGVLRTQTLRRRRWECLGQGLSRA